MISFNNLDIGGSKWGHKSKFRENNSQLTVYSKIGFRPVLNSKNRTLGTNLPDFGSADGTDTYREENLDIKHTKRTTEDAMTE
jgi:hypothetical protein